MIVQSAVRKYLIALLVALPLGAGCSGEMTENGPAEQPNVGPGEPPGTPPGVPKDKGSSSAGKAKTEKSKTEPGKK
jgi:hypothetical protein